MKFKRLFIVFIVFACLLSLSAISAASIDTNNTYQYASASDFYVSTDGSDNNEGTFQSPFKTIDKAVSQSKENDTTNIHLSQGIFKGSGNVNITVNNDINIIGSSCEKTIIDGSNNSWFLDISNAKVILNNLTIENFYMNVNKSGSHAGLIYSDSDIFMDNVIIQNNNIDVALGKDEEESTIYSSVIYSKGNISLNNVTGNNNHVNNTLGTDLDSLRKLVNWGGLINSFKSTTIRNSKFSNNSASRSSVVYAHILSNLTIENSVFENNTAFYSGGVFLTYLNTTTHISNSIFKNNNGTNAGGVIYQQRYSNLFVNDCEFFGNHANTGGSLYAHHYSNLTAENSIFVKGKAKTGSAILGADYVKLKVNNCTFKDNNGKQGAIMADEGCEINVDNSIFTNNKGVHGSSIMGDMINNITLSNSLFSNNVAEYGGVVYANFETTVWLINNSIINNRAVNGSVVFIDNTGTIDEDGEVTPHENITSRFISRNNYIVNNTSLDNRLFVNYPDSNRSGMEVFELTNNPSVKLGDIASFTIIIRNTGDYDLEGIYLIDDYDDGLEFSSFIGKNWYRNGNRFVYDGILKSNETVELTINFMAIKLGDLNNTVHVQSDLTNMISAVNSTKAIEDTIPQNENTTKDYSVNYKDVDASLNAGNPIVFLILSILTLVCFVAKRT